MKEKLEYLLKHNIFFQYIYRFVMSKFFHLIGIFLPVDQNCVLFSSFSGKHFDDSPKVLFDRMLQREDCHDLHYIWALNGIDDIYIENANIVRNRSWQYWKAALSSKYWITNVNIECGLSFKKPNQVYLNTWHGTGNKSYGNLAPGRKDYDLSCVDIFPVDGHFMAELHQKALNVKSTAFLYCGRPREDVLYRVTDAIRNRIRKDFGFDEGAFVVLYAPTWRESSERDSRFFFNPYLNLDKILHIFGERSVILYRAHSITTKTIGVEFGKHVIDCSLYPDINDLYIAADLLISDYSSVFADYSILGKPMLCYAFDYDNYARERGFTSDFREDITTFYDEDSLCDYLKNMDYEQESLKTLNFNRKYIQYGGDATDACIDALLAIGEQKV